MTPNDSLRAVKRCSLGLGVFFKSFAMLAIVANTIWMGYAANLNDPWPVLAS